MHDSGRVVSRRQEASMISSGAERRLSVSILSPVLRIQASQTRRTHSAVLPALGADTASELPAVRLNGKTFVHDSRSPREE